MPHPPLDIVAVVSMPMAENTYIAWRTGRSDCLVFDPGLEPERIFDVLDGRRLVPAAILNTHGHGDHIAGNEALKERWPDCPLLIGAGDAPLLSSPRLNLSADFGGWLVSPPADRLLADGEAFEAAGIALETREIPGHSPGHVVFVCREHDPPVVFGGDVLFAGSVGRTDLPGGSFDQLAAGIRAKLFTLPPETIVLPGHGEPTTIGHEQRTNPFVGEGARGHGGV
jgi:glyoxylase-like metal-dependent hydrolase (beta-lactamase superfamily II)